MPRPPLSDQRRSATRHAIAEAAVELFLRDGYATVSVEEIARSAGMSLRSFYRYVAAKEEVLDPLLGDAMEAFIEAFAAQPVDDDPASAAVAAYRATTDPNEEFRAHVVELLLSVPALRARWLDRQRSAEELLSSLLRERMPDASELDVRARAAMIIVALRLPLELAATGTLDGDVRAAQETLLRTAR